MGVFPTMIWCSKAFAYPFLVSASEKVGVLLAVGHKPAFSKYDTF